MTAVNSWLLLLLCITAIASIGGALWVLDRLEDE